MHKKRNGFTLIELLVVIAIITLLASILFPVFARARENARRATCQSNMKQISLGVLQYLQDYDAMFPERGGSPLAACATSFNDPLSWAAAIQPYVKSTQVFLCPSDTRQKIPSVTCTYGYNDHLANNNSNGSATEASIQHPSEMIMWYEDDYPNGSNSTWANIACQNWGVNFSVSNGAVTTRYHFSGQNWSFVDGHVKWYAMSGDNSYTQQGITWLSS